MNLGRLGVTLVLASVLTGCGGDEIETPDVELPELSACEAAFAAAAEAPDVEDTEAELWPAFAACEDFHQFASTAEEYPDALDGADPETYATEQCDSEETLPDTPVCQSLAG